MTSIDIENPSSSETRLRNALSDILQIAAPPVYTGSSLTVSDKFLYHLVATDDLLITVSMPFLELMMGDFSPNFNYITTLSLPSLTTVLGLFGPRIASLTTLDLSSLVTVDDNFNPSGALVTSVDLSSLSRTGGFTPTMESLTVLNLPSLTTIGNRGCRADLQSLTTLNVPALTTILGAFSPNMPLLTTLDLSSLVTVANAGFSPTFTSLTSLTLSPALKSFGSSFELGGAALDQESVDNSLIRLASLDGTGGTTIYENSYIYLNGGTSSAPGPSGLAAKIVLELRGHTVAVN